MGIFSFLDPVMNAIFGPLLSLRPFYAVLILSAFVTFLITVIYKYTTDQNLMKQLKEEQKELQKEMKALKDQPDKVMQVQKRAMQTNMKYMMQSMKSTLFTFIPIILIFGWANAHYAFTPILPNEEFIVTATFEEKDGSILLTVPDEIILLSDKTQEIKANKASWALKAPEGEYFLEFSYKDISYTKKIKVHPQLYEKPDTVINKNGFKEITTDQDKQIIMDLFGWKLGWLGTYIIFSIIFSIFFRKWMKVY